MKLPDIGVRGVPQIASPKSARLNTDLRNIGAGVQAVDTLSKQVTGLLEAEVKTDAARRASAAQRDYLSKSTEIVRDYHTNRDLDVRALPDALAAAQREAFDTVGKDVNMFVNKRLAAAQEDFKTRIQPSQLEAVARVTESRQIMNMTDIQRDAFAGLRPNSSVEEVLATARFVDTQWKQSGLDAVTVHEGTSNFTANYLTGAIGVWASAGDIQSMTDISETDAFKNIGPEGRLQLQAKIDVAQATILDNLASGVKGEVADGNMTLDLGVEMWVNKVAETNMSQSQKDEFAQAGAEDVFSSKMDGLLATQQYEAATALLDDEAYGLNGTNIKPGTKVPGWRNSIRSGEATSSSVSTTVLISNLKDMNTRMLDGGTIDGPLTAQAIAIRDSGMLSQSQLQSLNLELATADEYNQVNYQIGSIPSSTTAQLHDQILGIDEELRIITGEASSIGYRNKKTALEAVRGTLVEHDTERQDKPVDYAIRVSPHVNDAWDKWTTLTRQLMRDPETTSLADVQLAYANYSALVNQAQDSYGTPTRGRSTIPSDSTALQGLMDTMLEGTFTEQQRSVDVLKSIMGVQGLSDMVATIMDDEPTTAMMLAYHALPQGAGLIDAEIMHRGERVAEQQKGAIPTNEDFRKSLNANNVSMPFTALGDLNRIVSASVYTYALGIATDEELSNGQFEQTTLVQARNAVIGEPFQISPNANFTVPFRDEQTGQMVPSQDIKNTFIRARTEYNYGNDTFGKVFNAQGEQLVWHTALEYATPVMIANGVYQLGVTNAGGYGRRGALMMRDPNGNLVRMVINLNMVDTTVNRSFHSMGEVDLSRVN